MIAEKLRAVPLKDVKLNGGLLGNKSELVRREVIPYQWKALNDEIPGAEPSNAIENFRIAAGESEGEFIGMVFQDSDLAKWLEAVAYHLTTHPNQELEKLADEVIELIARAQQDDGYLNTYFTVAEPDKRWTNLAECHELYCAGHMIEAAAAYYQATGKSKFLDVMASFADLIYQTFGNDIGKLKGYPGHQEIELALMKLYDVTGEDRYKELAKYFIDQRGQQPHYFEIEREKRGGTAFWSKENEMADWEYFQAHKPVREQEEAIGHAVRALYMYSGMADVARETGDKSLLEACRRLWDNTTKRQMYITGGVGSSGHQESFTIDYDLPNDTAYTETCAAIALVFFAQRMFHLEPKGEYIDVLERSLYNGVLSGISEDGQKFFYVNPLEVLPGVCENRNDHKHVKITRQKWFGCACCPPNIARLLASIGQYIYSYSDEGFYVNLFVDSTAVVELMGQKFKITQETNYPWDGEVNLTISTAQDTEDYPVGTVEDDQSSLEFTVALRLPAWCEEAELKLDGEPIDISDLLSDGYLYLKRHWANHTQLKLTLQMSSEKVYANPLVRENVGKMAIQRGPIIYCLEEVDNGSDLPLIYLVENTELKAEYHSNLLGGLTVIKGEALKIDQSEWEGELYHTRKPKFIPTEITAIPYYAWDNRGTGEMLVWINSLE